MPPVCLEYHRLFIDSDGYFYICAGIGGGGRKLTLWLNPFLRWGLGSEMQEAREHNCTCCSASSVCLRVMMLNIYEDLRPRWENQWETLRDRGRGTNESEEEEKNKTNRALIDWNETRQYFFSVLTHQTFTAAVCARAPIWNKTTTPEI